MAYCRNCGTEIDENADICVHCGVKQNVYRNVPAVETMSDSGSFGWGVLGFFIPIAGLILFLVWHDTKPKCAKSAGIGALISTAVSIIIAFIFMALWCSVMFSVIGEAIVY